MLWTSEKPGFSWSYEAEVLLWYMTTIAKINPVGILCEDISRKV